MIEENKYEVPVRSVFITRLKALAWHVGTMLVPVLVDFVSTNIELFNLPTWVVIGVGLVLAQITKYLNTPKG